MGAKNLVIGGEYEGKGLTILKNEVCLVLKCNFIRTEKIVLDKSTIESYELITEEHQKSAVSGIARGIVGGVLLGPVGLLGGALSAKNKGTSTVAVQFKDGKRSLLEVDEKIYKKIVQKCFQ